MSQDTPQDTPTAVLFNADCPICNAEIRHYARIAQADGLPIRFDSLSSHAAWGLDAESAAQRLHVAHQGQIVSGVAAFLVLWAQMPRYRWLARLIGLPVIRQIATLCYDWVLAPMLYRAHLRRQSRGCTDAR